MHLCCCCSRRLLKRPPHNSQSAPPAHDSRNAPPGSSSALNKNFNSLYDSPAEPDTLTGSYTTRTLTTATAATATTTAEEGEDDVITSSESEPDLSAVFASRRLTRPASTGRSNSILVELEEEEDESRAVGFGAVPKMSPDPYEDFKKSIEEMVAALGLRRPAVDDQDEQQQQQQQVRRLQELLLCYLALNRKNAHKYIVGAFADVLRGFSLHTTGG